MMGKLNQSIFYQGQCNDLPQVREPNTRMGVSS